MITAWARRDECFELSRWRQYAELLKHTEGQKVFGNLSANTFRKIQERQKYWMEMTSYLFGSLYMNERKLNSRYVFYEQARFLSVMRVILQ